MGSLPTAAPVIRTDTASEPERRALLALSILEHRIAVRDQYQGAEREAFLRGAVDAAAAALAGEPLPAIVMAAMAVTGT